MLTIRPAAPDDVPLLADIGARTYLDHYRDFWSPEGLERYLAQHFAHDVLRALLADPTVCYDLAFAGDVPVCFTKVNRDRVVPDGSGRRGSELQKIYFTAAATGRGYGGELIGHVCARAAREGEPLVWLNVLEANTPGVRFYERMGFRRAGGDYVFDTGHVQVAMWLMVRAT
jgi:ribosomal protein S18 acetylase RimI-like enzyme